MTHPEVLAGLPAEPDSVKAARIITSIGNRILNLEHEGAESIIIGDTNIIHDRGEFNLAGVWSISSGTHVGRLESVRGRFVSTPLYVEPSYSMVRTHHPDGRSDPVTSLSFVPGDTTIPIARATPNQTPGKPFIPEEPFIISESESLVALFDGLLQAIQLERAS